MSYQVLARKWRPANFQQMVGQEHVLQALINALDSNRLHHAYLFTGTRGVGKTTIARIFAKSLNCEQGVTSKPCGDCSSCLEIDEGRSVDLIEIDAASRTGVDDMRELLDNVQYAPTRGRFKIYLIDEVHMLSKHSFNALLKTLEEPPPHVKFLLATTDPQKVPVTVLSRCLQFNLKRMSRAQILSQLQYLTEQEEVAADAAALGQLASAADGSMRDALSLLDQAIGYGGGAVKQDAVESMLGSISRDYLTRLLDALKAQQATDLLKEARAVIEHNPDYQRVCAEMIALFQQVAIYQHDAELRRDSEFEAELLQRYADHWSAEEVQLYYQIMLQGRHDLLISPDEASAFEMLMLRLLAFTPEAIGSAQIETNTGLKKKPELSPSRVAPTESAPDSAMTAIETPVVPPIDDLEVSGADVLRDNEASPEFRGDEPEADSVASFVTPGNTGDPVMETGANESLQGTSAEAFDWPMLAYDLTLDGLAQQIAANSQLQDYCDDRLRLALLPELHELANDTTRSEIKQALQQKLGVSLQLELVAVDALTADTPLMVKARRLEQEKQDAIVAIRQDSTVKKLQQAFAAELDETTVVKAEKNCL